MHTLLLCTSGLFDQQSSSVRNRLGDPYLEAVNLSFTFTWDDEKIEDRAKVSMSPLVEGLSINNIELRDISAKIRCMAIQI